MTIELENLHLFVQDLLKKHSISVSQLAEKAGFQDPTVYEYTGGRKPNLTWLKILAALFCLTEDTRILELLTQETPYYVVALPEDVKKGGNLDSLKTLCEMQKKHLQRTEAIVDILSDGKVDKNDRVAIEKLDDAHYEALKLEAQLFYTIKKLYEEACTK